MATMLEQLSDQIRRCLEHAAEAKAKADATDDPVLRVEFLDNETALAVFGPHSLTGASFQIDYALLAISQSMIDESRELLASLRNGQANAALLMNSRAMIDESRRLLAALERPAPARRNDNGHQDAIATPAAAPIEPSAGGVRADADRNPAMLSVRIFGKGSCFGWTVYGPTNEPLGRGTAETEHKARTDAFTAGMTYIDRAKGRSAPGDTSLH